VRREFENLQRIRDLGLDAPEPVAFGEERRRGWLTRSYLISAGVPDPCSLDVYLREDIAARPRAQQAIARIELINRLADYARRMHEQHFVHHDFFWRNILLSEGSLAHFYLIDSHQGDCWKTGEGWRFRVQDLAALDAPAPAFFRRTERLRFFLKYRGLGRLSALDKRRLRQIVATADRQRARELRRVQMAAGHLTSVQSGVSGD
jgi:RIO-like serine/threonine protein kinase